MTENEALKQLAERAQFSQPRVGGMAHVQRGDTVMARVPEPKQDDPVYDFEHLGLKIAESLVVAAENQVAEANALLAQTRALADSIREQVQIQTDALASLNGRLKTFGQQMLDAHRKFNGDKHGDNDGS